MRKKTEVTRTDKAFHRAVAALSVFVFTLTSVPTSGFAGEDTLRISQIQDQPGAGLEELGQQMRSGFWGWASSVFTRWLYGEGRSVGSSGRKRVSLGFDRLEGGPRIGSPLIGGMLSGALPPAMTALAETSPAAQAFEAPRNHESETPISPELAEQFFSSEETLAKETVKFDKLPTYTKSIPVGGNFRATLILELDPKAPPQTVEVGIEISRAGSSEPAKEYLAKVTVQPGTASYEVEVPGSWFEAHKFGEGHYDVNFYVNQGDTAIGELFLNQPLKIGDPPSKAEEPPPWWDDPSRDKRPRLGAPPMEATPARPSRSEGSYEAYPSPASSGSGIQSEFPTLHQQNEDIFEDARLSLVEVTHPSSVKSGEAVPADFILRNNGTTSGGVTLAASVRSALSNPDDPASYLHFERWDVVPVGGATLRLVLTNLPAGPNIATFRVLAGPYGKIPIGPQADPSQRGIFGRVIQVGTPGLMFGGEDISHPTRVAEVDQAVPVTYWVTNSGSAPGAVNLVVTSRSALKEDRPENYREVVFPRSRTDPPLLVGAGQRVRFDVTLPAFAEAGPQIVSFRVHDAARDPRVDPTAWIGPQADPSQRGIFGRVIQVGEDPGTGHGSGSSEQTQRSAISVTEVEALFTEPSKVAVPPAPSADVLSKVAMEHIRALEDSSYPGLIEVEPDVVPPLRRRAAHDALFGQYDPAAIFSGLEEPVSETPSVRVAVLSPAAAAQVGLEQLNGTARRVANGWVAVLPRKYSPEALAELLMQFAGYTNVVFQPYGGLEEFTAFNRTAELVGSVQPPIEMKGRTLAEFLRMLAANLAGLEESAVSGDQLEQIQEALGLHVQM